ncbi:MAG: tryptophan 2,3-dioxygenase family protein [Bacteroidota bacterium]
MDRSEIDQRIIEQIKKLESKYEVMGQDLSSYLDGLLYSDYLTYWDYIHLDTLLSLQSPKTGFKDEFVFIVYHQITELYFKLILWEINQIAEQKHLDEEFFLERINRVLRYFEQLQHSFAIMREGMETEQFLKFRMALLPSSGFQSAQYRMIEICSTDLINLVDVNRREALESNNDFDQMLENLYWRSGATELASGKKTLTLRQFEDKYDEDFARKANDYKERNLLRLFEKHFQSSDKKEEIISSLRELDVLANISWRLAHYRSAAKYLHKDPKDIKATGGTNWQKYLPPRFQKVIFFPNLWSEEEKENWGHPALENEVLQKEKGNL